MFAFWRSKHTLLYGLQFKLNSWQDQDDRFYGRLVLPGPMSGLLLDISAGNNKRTIL